MSLIPYHGPEIRYPLMLDFHLEKWKYWHYIWFVINFPIFVLANILLTSIMVCLSMYLYLVSFLLKNKCRIGLFIFTVLALTFYIFSLQEYIHEQKALSMSLSSGGYYIAGDWYLDSYAMPPCFLTEGFAATAISMCIWFPIWRN